MLAESPFDTGRGRNRLYRALIAEERAKLVGTDGWISGQQIAYAKGRATRRFNELERSYYAEASAATLAP